MRELRRRSTGFLAALRTSSKFLRAMFECPPEAKKKRPPAFSRAASLASEPHGSAMGLSNGAQDAIERGTRPHGLRRQLRVRVVIAADVDGLALHADELRHDLLLARFERGCDLVESRAQRLVFRLVGQRTCPVHGEVEMTAPIVDAADGPRRRFVAVEEPAVRYVECFRHGDGRGIARPRAVVFDRYGERQELA